MRQVVGRTNGDARERARTEKRASAKAGRVTRRPHARCGDAFGSAQRAAERLSDIAPPASAWRTGRWAGEMCSQRRGGVRTRGKSLWRVPRVFLNLPSCAVDGLQDFGRWRLALRGVESRREESPRAANVYLKSGNSEVINHPRDFRGVPRIFFGVVDSRSAHSS